MYPFPIFGFMPRNFQLQEEKEEKSETESAFDFAFDNVNTFFVAGFFQVSGASIKSLKIPFQEGKAPLYILFKNFRVHLA